MFQDITETCEDRCYECCELTPPVADPTSEEYLAWHDRHREIYWQRKRSNITKREEEQ